MRARSVFCLTSALMLSACGHASVTFSNVSNTAADKPSDVQSLIDASAQKAVVFEVPVSKVLIQATPASGVTPPKPADQQQAASPPAAAQNSDQKKAGNKKTAAVTPPNPADQQQGAPPPAAPQNAGSTSTADAASTVTQTITVKGTTYSISVLPTPGGMTLRATATNDLFSQNDLGVTKLANSDIPTSVSNTFTDLTASRITSVGTIVSSAIGLAALMSANTDVPCADTTLGTTSFTIGTGTLAKGTYQSTDTSHPTCWVYLFQADGHQSDVVNRKTFLDGFLDKAIKSWPVPACLNGTLKIYQSQPADSSAAPDIAVPLTIIDPDYIRLVGLPDKGKISLHPVCDADFADTASDKWGAVTDVISALETQAKAVGGGSAKTASPSPAPKN